ncbi:MAG: DUF5020 family protein [Ignavibacteriaceae bacterium]|jgi:hypothetical protein|nr:DUF5020 family protein [Ignavibacteriaceae bacterium]
MKKLLLVFFLLMAAKVTAQNLQLHYDLGEDRKYFTTTIEMFKPDEYGSTFFFVDFDFNMPENKSISLAYWEIARYVTVYEKLSVTLQYNDGFVTIPTPVGNYSGTLNQSWLAGVSYPIDLGFVTLNTDLLAKKIYKSDGLDVQLTTVWFVPFLEGKLNFTGFLDIWTQDKNLRAGAIGSDKEMVFLTEPQLWYNFDKHLSVGTEIEISNNFLPFQDEIKVNPTIAVKWNF